MNASRNPCTLCGTRDTASTTGLCWECRPCPTVCTDGDGYIRVDGLPPLSRNKAMQLAHRLADVLAQ